MNRQQQKKTLTIILTNKQAEKRTDGKEKASLQYDTKFILKKTTFNVKIVI